MNKDEAEAIARKYLADQITFKVIEDTEGSRLPISIVGYCQ